MLMNLKVGALYEIKIEEAVFINFSYFGWANDDRFTGTSLYLGRNRFYNLKHQYIVRIKDSKKSKDIKVLYVGPGFQSFFVEKDLLQFEEIQTEP